MRQSARFAALAMLACVSTAPMALAGRGWMTEADMRGAFIGKTLDGQYVGGLEWTETYDLNGRLDYKESARVGGGYWYFRDHVFCTFYDPGQGLNGGCFTAIQASANCYEFYMAALGEREADKTEPPGQAGRWVARASRRGEPSTCEGRPSV